jgi:hypothetical protein
MLSPTYSIDNLEAFCDTIDDAIHHGPFDPYRTYRSLTIAFHNTRCESDFLETDDNMVDDLLDLWPPGNVCSTYGVRTIRQPDLNYIVHRLAGCSLRRLNAPFQSPHFACGHALDTLKQHLYSHFP